MRINAVNRSEYADFYAGYLAQVATEYTLVEELEISLDQKLEISSFLWDNWYRLSEKSIRTAEKMADLMENYPDTYKDIWKDEFLLH